MYAKNLPKDAVAVQLTGADKLRICVKAQPSSSSSAGTAAAAADEEDYVLELDLFDKVRQQVGFKSHSRAVAGAAGS